MKHMSANSGNSIVYGELVPFQLNNISLLLEIKSYNVDI
jgi:hypothetical protein